jgi:hypothetical protein
MIASWNACVVAAIVNPASAAGAGRPTLTDATAACVLAAADARAR